MSQSSSASDANVHVNNAMKRNDGRIGQQRGTAVIPSTTRNNNHPPAAQGNNAPSASRGNNNPPAARGNNNSPAARGNNNSAAARGNNNPPAARGNNNSAAARGNNSRPAARGNNNSAAARGNNNPAAARGNNNSAAARGNNNPPAARGNNNSAAARGNNNWAAARGNNNPPAARGNNSPPAARGNNNSAAARGYNNPPAARGYNTHSPRQNRTPVEHESSSTSTTKTYVDNAHKRRPDRVGLPHGTAVESATHRRSPKSQSGNTKESLFRPNGVSKYVDSSTYRIKPRCSLGGVNRGQNNASPVLHDSHDSSTLRLSADSVTRIKTKHCTREPNGVSKYVDSSTYRIKPRCSLEGVNRGQNNASPVLHDSHDSSTIRLSADSVTRIKTKHCTRENRDTLNYTGSSTKAPNLYDDLVCGESREEGHLHTRTPSITFSELKDDGKAANRGKPKTEKRYVNNYYNRKHICVGLLHGEAKISQKNEARGDCPEANAGEVEAVVQKRDQPNAEFTKFYANYSQNRKLDWVGMPHGTMVYSKKTNDITRRVYADTPLNRKLGRAGKPLGSMPRKSIVTYKIPQIIEKLRTNEISETADNDGIPNGMFETKDPSRTALRQAICYNNRQQAERSWQKAFKEPPKTEMSILEDYNGKKIDFNELKLHARIGRGGFGEVYFAKWHETVVAVKTLRTEKFTDKNIVTFAEEVKKFCKLDHPNIVKFIGACTDMPDLCIVMEYMQYSLYDAIHVHKLNFNDDDILNITQQVCKGIKYLHERRIAHCDIKTANILLDYVENQICEAKITDFGLSMMMQNTTQSLTGDELVCHRGTPRYSAPEILRGDVLCLRDIMHTDVYSLGLVLFEIIFFEEPYHDLSSVQMRHQVGENGVTPEISNDVRVDEDVLDIIHKTWQFEPHLRPKAREISDVMNRTLNIFGDTESH